MDHRIRMRGGTTMAIELSPSRVQQQKNHPPSTLEENFIDLYKKEGFLRRENGFYRGCFSASCQMVDDVYEVCQLLMLAYYHNPEFPLKILEELREHALVLQKAVNKYECVVLQMEEEWVDEWQPKDGHRISEYRNVI
jgi:hypothetical protein